MFSQLSLYHQTYCNMKKSFYTSSSVEICGLCQTTLTYLKSFLAYINYPKNNFDSSATLSIRTILPFLLTLSRPAIMFGLDLRFFATDIHLLPQLLFPQQWSHVCMPVHKALNRIYHCYNQKYGGPVWRNINWNSTGSKSVMPLFHQTIESL